MKSISSPENYEEVAELVRQGRRVLAVGARTKPRLSMVTGDVEEISTLNLRGMVEYMPEEFTFTARAGTSLQDIAGLLKQSGQYLPFDPVFAAQGSTLGGCIASGISGPGRFRFGGIRDFVLGLKFVDGSGRILNMGGKVVKNAAGFDLPKFLVGSLGRFGIVVEATFKVFPRPVSTLTLRINSGSLTDSIRIVLESAVQRWELLAIEVPHPGDSVLLKLGGNLKAIEKIGEEILSRWSGKMLSPEEADLIWNQSAGFEWRHDGGPLIKVPVIPDEVQLLVESFSMFKDVRIHFGNAANVAYVSLPSTEQSVAASEMLAGLGLTGLTFSGAGPLWTGIQKKTEIAKSVRAVLDPDNKFPALED